MNEPVKLVLREDRKIAVVTSHHDKENIRDGVPGSTWNHKERVWTVPLSWAAMLQLRGVFGTRLDVATDLTDLSWQVYRGRVEPCMALRQAPDCEWVEDKKLSPLQRAGVGFMATAGQALNADPMGAGKTPMTISALKYLEDPWPALVVAPNSVKPHWRNEFATWWPDIKVSVVAGGAAKRRKALEEEAEVYVLNWEALHLHSRLAGYGSIKLSDKEKELKELNHMPFRTVIADEAHRAKAPKAKQTRALWYIGDRATYRYALTGTPVANTPEDLWAVMRFVAPDEYPSKTKWIDRYGLFRWNPFGKMDVVGLRGDTQDELFGFLDPRFIRRPKELILPDLPEKLPTQVRLVDLKPKQRKAYDKMRKEMLVELDGGVLMAKNPLQRAIRLRQLCGATGELTWNEDTEKWDVSLKEPSSKIDDLIDVLEELEPGEKVSVFAESRQLIELAHARLEKEGYSVAMFTGTVDPAQREANRLAFQEGDLQILLLTYGAGAEGVNLSRTDVQVYLERHRSLIKNKQAEERGQRPGRVGRLREIEIVAADSIDQDVLEDYGEKKELFETVVRDEDSLRTWLEKK